MVTTCWLLDGDMHDHFGRNAIEKLDDDASSLEPQLSQKTRSLNASTGGSTRGRVGGAVDLSLQLPLL